MRVAEESHKSSMQVSAHHCGHRHGDEAGCARSWNIGCNKGRFLGILTTRYSRKGVSSKELLEKSFLFRKRDDQLFIGEGTLATAA